MNQQQVEQLRWATLEYLACRSACAFSAEQVLRGLVSSGASHMIGATLDKPSVEAALAFLVSDNLTTKPDLNTRMSAITVYQVTSRGTLAWERKRFEQEG